MRPSPENCHAVINLRRAGNDYTTIMKAAGHKTMSMFLRYNLVNEEDVAGMKWKGEQKQDQKSLEEQLTAAGFDIDEIKMLLKANQKSDQQAM